MTFRQLNRRRSVTVAVLVVALFSTVSAVRPAEGDEHPNVIFVLLDDLAYWQLGALGNKDVETPAMDSLARKGVLLTNFYASPGCAISRASFMTGRHFLRTGAFDVFPGRSILDLDEIVLAELLREEGYQTGIIGKWHLGSFGEHHPQKRGFETTFGVTGHMDRINPDKLDADGHTVSAVGHITDIFTNQAIRFLRRHQNDRFFLFLSHTAPHAPWEAPDSLVERFLSRGHGLRTAKAYAMIRHLDSSIGRLLAELDTLELTERTLVILTSDNGGIDVGNNSGLRGQKASVYEGGLKVPFIASWPGKLAQGAVVTAQAQNIDVLPTIAEAVGAPLPSDREIDGRSLLELLKVGGGESPHEYIYSQWNRVLPVLGWAEAKSPPGKRGRVGHHPNWAIRNREGLKLVVNSDYPEGALFDLGVDPAESRDVSDQQPQAAAQLRAEFEKWFEAVTAGEEFSTRFPPIGWQAVSRANLLAAEVRGPTVSASFGGGGILATNWTQAGDSLSWTLQVARAGRYRVQVTYSCEPGKGGSRFVVSSGESKIVHVVEETPGSDVFRTIDIGALEFDQGEAELVLEATAVEGDEMMALKRVEFRLAD